MTTTDKYFIRILADHLHSRPTEPQHIDWQELYSLSRKHELTGIVYMQCKAFIPEKDPFIGRWCAEASAYVRRKELYSAVSKALKDEEIEFFPVKGLTISSLYPVPALRTMGDCDLVVHKKDKEKAHKILLDMGFKDRLKENQEWIYFKQDLGFELHDRLLYDEVGNSIEAKRMVKNCWDYVVDGKLDWSFHYVFLLLHLHKHLIHSGAGFRQFMDIYLAAQLPLNWIWIKEQLSALDLVDFYEVVLGLCQYWFEEGEETEERIAMTEQILHNGVFGFHDPANRTHHSADVMIHGPGLLILTRARVLIGFAFPRYEWMRYSPYYAGLDNRPYLLPAFWIYRWYRAVKYRMADNGKRIMKDALVSKEKIEKRKQERAKWGL